MNEKKEYIERGALIAFVREVRKKLPKDSKDFFTRDEMLLNFQQYLESQKAADVEPVVRGEWKDGIDFDEQNVYMCSVCKEPYILESGTPKENKYNFCPNCGAYMMERSGSGE